MSVALSNNFVKTDEPGGAHRNRVVALGVAMVCLPP